MVQRKQSSRKLVIILGVVVVLMFGFAYALVPLYRVFCNVFGINGKTNTTAIAKDQAVDTSRTITVQFISHINSNLHWVFKPTVKTIHIHPGANTKVSYYAKNLENKRVTVQAVPSVTPGLAAKYLKKTECFCFTQQSLNKQQSIDMPILFHIDRSLPKKIKEITLSYTLYKAKQVIKNKKQGRIQ